MSAKLEFKVLKQVGIDGKGYAKGSKIKLDPESLDTRYMLGMEQIEPATKEAAEVIKKIDEKAKQ